MLSKNKIQLIRSLRSKKKRNELGLFIVEGSKSVDEMLLYFPCRMLLHTHDYNTMCKVEFQQEVSINELKNISLLEEPQQVLGVFEIPRREWSNNYLHSQLVLALDAIQDPGNLGTIIRIADWFGIKHILCSHGTVDVYNPKTIQATMGAISRVYVYTVDLVSLFKELPGNYPVYGTFVDGDNIYTQQLQQEGIIIMGNEGNGISNQIEELVSQRISIPSYPPNELTSESLNVAMATAIICAEFRRRLL
jgi:RNA methyltransferase, TrmH family